MKTIQNPILRGFCPDPCMIRTGDDYYIATSTFEWWPCVNLYHSKDLAHWEQLPSPLREPGQMDLRGDPNSGGIWAPDLSWDGQYYYLLVTNVTTKKGRWYNTHNYMSRAASITGPWSQPVYLNSIGFDPSLLHDTDGKCYLVNMIHNTLRCMYWHSLPDALAERFVKEHLLNPQEFWTKMPLPSVAANDPLFRNVTTNNWSGQAEALTYQRAIRALENYGMYELIPQLGQKLMQAIGPQCRFVQQYDPFTGEPSVICEPGQPPQDAYGPAMLSVLEYTARMYGVSLVRDTVVWGTCPLECRYTQALNGRSWEIVNSGHEAEAFVDGRKVFTAGPGLRITTDLDGNILGTARYLPDADPAQVTPQ